MRKIALLLIVCCVLVSCSWFKKTTKETGNPVDLYVAGVNLMQAKKYEPAIAKFSAIREQYPFDPMALVATVKLGDTYFLKKDYVLAAGTYEDYFKAHPDEENIPYVLFKLGECYEKLSPSVDRDQANTVKGIERITYLRNRYPTSSYAIESEKRLKSFIQKLADRELYVGEFYYKTAQYNATILRLEEMLKKFPDLKNTDKALFYLAQAHRELGNQEKSDEYLQRLRTDFPKSIYARATVRQRKTLKATDDQKKPASPEASAMPAGTTAAAPAPQYTEKTKKEIDLRPPDQPVQTASATEPKPEVKVASQPQAQPASGDQAKAASARDRAIQSSSAPAQVAAVPAKKPAETKKTSDKGLGFLDQKKPIDIVSDTMEGFDKEKYVFFKGNVVARQDDLYIYSDTMEAFMSPDTNEIEKANAKGSVRIIKQNRTATCKEAYFDNVKGEIILKGNAIVTSGKDKVEGDVVTYYVNEDRAVVNADKDKKAKVTIYPEKR